MMYGLVCVHVHNNCISQVQQPTDKSTVCADLVHPDGNSRPAAPPSCDADKVKYAYVKSITEQEPQVSTKVSSDATIEILVPVLCY